MVFTGSGLSLPVIVQEVIYATTMQEMWKALE